MDKRLKDILSKVVEQKPDTLSEADLTYIDGLVHPEKMASDSDVRPLWYWTRKQAFLHKNVINFDIDPEIDVILNDAGADLGPLTYEMEEVRRLAPVTKDGLVRAVRRHLTHQTVQTRAHAARLIGMAELTSCVDLLVESLESGREERADWGMPVIAASIEALAMLRHPAAGKFAAKYIENEDYGLRRAAHAALLMAEGLDGDAFKRFVRGSFESELINHFPGKFVHAAKEGAFTEADLIRIVDDLYFHNIHGYESAADIVVSAGWEEAFQRLVSRDGNFAAALGVRAAWTDSTWAIPMLTKRLEEEDWRDAKMALVASIGSFGTQKAFVEKNLESDEEAEREGAVWASVGRPELNDKIKKLVEDEDASIRRAATTVLALNAGDLNADLLELKYNELLNIDSWWPWAVPAKAIRQVDVPVPRSMRAFDWISNDLSANGRTLDEALGFFADNSMELVRWLGPTVPDDQRMRAICFAGLTSPDLRGAMESGSLCINSCWDATHAYREIQSLGGATSPLARVKGLMASHREPKAGEDDLVPALMLTQSGDTETRQRATKSLQSQAKEAEAYLPILLDSNVEMVAEAATQVASALRGASDPFVNDVAKILNSEARSLADLTTPERLVSCAAPTVRSKLAEVAGLPANSRDEAMPYLLKLAVDTRSNVAATALSCLANHAGEEVWVQDLILQNTYSDDYFVREKALMAMAQVGEPRFLDRLISLATDTEDDHMAENAIKGLVQLADKRPELGLVVLDIRQPYRVVQRYGLNERINYDADEHSESLRILMLALEGRKDEARAKELAGRKVMLSPASAEAQASMAGQWSAEEFEQLALYLKVSFADEESGSIIAEIGSEPSGEVLSALLQTSSVSVTTAAWS